MTLTERAASTVTRARKVVGLGIYGLGKGGRDPQRPVPWDPDQLIDCSGFVCWCIDLDRKQGDTWLSTDGLIRVASKSNSMGLSLVTNPQPGDLVVYGDYVKEGKHRQGHTAVIVEVGGWGRWDQLHIVHASMGNMTATNQAVAETPGTLFGAHASVFVRRTF